MTNDEWQMTKEIRSQGGFKKNRGGKSAIVAADVSRLTLKKINGTEP